MALTDDIVSYWKNDESGDANREDAVASNDLVCTNTGNTDSGTGIINNGTDLTRSNTDGAGGYILLADDTGSGLNFSDIFSTSFWVYNRSYPGTTGEAATFVTRRLAAGTNVYTIMYERDNGLNQRKLRIEATGGAADYKENTTTDFLAVNTWYHIVYTKTGTTSHFYINGVDKTLTANLSTGGLNTGAGTFRLGSYNGGSGGVGNRQMDGVIDEVGIWSRVLTQEEVTTLYNGGAGIQYPFSDPGPANLKSLDTNLKANIKSYNTNVLANIKSINTNA